MTYEVAKSDSEWRAKLSKDEYRVLREAATEAPYTGEYEDTETEGVYRCRACGNELFRSDTKFNAHCGWPAFYDPADSSAVELIEDRSHGMSRTEVRCARCGSHLGHVFRGEGFHTPTDERYCINSISLTLEPAQSESGSQSGSADAAGSAG
jgi:peptide-methionine (R)-S-oxide reductase